MKTINLILLVVSLLIAYPALAQSVSHTDSINAITKETLKLAEDGKLARKVMVNAYDEVTASQTILDSAINREVNARKNLDSAIETNNSATITTAKTNYQIIYDKYSEAYKNNKSARQLYNDKKADWEKKVADAKVALGNLKKLQGKKLTW